jgi:hypothetical protein
MMLYQEPVWFPGIVFLLVIVAGLAGLIRRWRRGGDYAALAALAALAWGVALVNLVIPIAAHEMDYRYAISAVPFACLALGLVLVRKPPATEAPAGPMPAVADAAAAS